MPDYNLTSSWAEVDNAAQSVKNNVFVPRAQQATKTSEYTEPAAIDSVGKIWTKPGSGGEGTTDHSQLSNRDAANQHPISAITGLSGELDAKYEKPSGGIPWQDLKSDVVTSLGKADTAYQKPSSGIPASDLASTVQTSLGKADGAVQKSAQAAKTAGMTNRVGIDENGVLWSVPGGGSGGGATKYTVTLSGSASPYTASMSASEIYTAVQGGNIVEAAFDGEVLALTKSTSSAAIFVGHALTASEFIGLAIAISGTTALTTTIPIQPKSIADTAGYFTTDTVEGALAEIGAQLDGLEAALTALL